MQTLAIDCEMVTCYHNNTKKMMAGRVSIVDIHDNVLLDALMQPPGKIINYNTKYSGLSKKILKNAPPLFVVQRLVQSIIKDKLLIGHAIDNDLAALGIYHPKEHIEDTQKMSTIILTCNNKQPSLKHAAKIILNTDIQNNGPHDSVQDAKATMAIYKW